MSGRCPIIGLLGGMGWPSTSRYYATINGLAGETDRTVHVLVNSLAFNDLLAAAESDGFEAVGDTLATEARRLERAGADVVMLCAVTAHLAHAKVSNAVNIAVPHIADGIARHLENNRETTFGLLGTEPALTGDALGLKSAGLIPSRDRLAALDGAIRHDIAFGRIGPRQIAVVDAAEADLERQGATAIILACTELPLLADQLAGDLPKVDAVDLHCRRTLNDLWAR